ncbi:hypothetical protein PR370_01035 [Mycobacterium marinum]|uniref:hypothetical protein n=1 Tax=Mycobacterium marinum TaxID=1781 RepID=UPI00235A44B5|nr:hypothetical protein [Mycobacterium marinum]MDC8980681.1 hypothetical protein [Mycobacterium marinum]MDC8997893.1 hypothetical protein [Mycobacterium marinum]MDC9008633.1 hypothetical protein [Mycobacterium marinum]
MTGLTSGELALYRSVLHRCRESAVDASEEAVKAVMTRNSAVLGVIDAAVAALDPRPGESAAEHRRRIDAAVERLEL